MMDCAERCAISAAACMARLRASSGDRRRFDVRPGHCAEGRILPHTGRCFSLAGAESMMRNLLTAVAALAIVGAAGAVFLAMGETSSDETPATSGSTAISGAAGTMASAPAAQTAQADQAEIGADEHVLGKIDAPVTIIEYASMTCPHCAAFHVQTMPRIKAEFIDKGLVRFVFRPFPLDGLAARASLLAECAPGDGYFGMLDVLFRSQKDWAYAADPVAELKKIGRTAGLPDADIDRCIADEAAANRMAAGMQEAQAKFGIDSTPSFVVNGTTYANMPFDDYEDGGTAKPGFGTVIKNLLPKT
jgi:protein-disulfide isomerase